MASLLIFAVVIASALIGVLASVPVKLVLFCALAFAYFLQGGE